MIELATHYWVDEDEIMGDIPHTWWQNIRLEAVNRIHEGCSVQLIVQEWGGEFRRGTRNDVVRFEKEEDVTLFLLRWS